MPDLQKALEDMDDMIEAIERGDLLMLDADEGLRLLVVKQNALKKAVGDRERLLALIAALNARHEHGGNTRIDLANELWRALPDDLRRDIEMREAAIG